MTSRRSLVLALAAASALSLAACGSGSSAPTTTSSSASSSVSSTASGSSASTSSDQSTPTPRTQAPPGPAGTYSRGLKPADGVPVQRRNDIQYAVDSNEQTFDLIRPAEDRAAYYPVVVFIHGGGWTSGSKGLIDGGNQQMDHLRDALLGHGFAVASLDYRLAPGARWPAQRDDVEAALRYLRDNAKVLGVDPDRIAVSGESAGGHLAAWAGVITTRTDLQGSVGVTKVSPKVNAVVSYYGVLDLAARQSQLKAQGCSPDPKALRDLAWAFLGKDPLTPAGAAALKSASPADFVASGQPPVLLLHGKADCTAPPAQSVEYAGLLQGKGIANQVILVDGAAHAQSVFYTRADLLAAVVGWVERYDR